MAASKVAQILQKLSTAHLSSKDRLSSCQTVADTLPSSPDALASFSSNRGAACSASLALGSGLTCWCVSCNHHYTLSAGVQVLLQQLGHSSTSTSLLTSILQSLTYTIKADQASAQASASFAIIALQHFLINTFYDLTDQWCSILVSSW